MLDMLAAIARKDYIDRKRRQAQGIAKLHGYKGREPDTRRNAGIMQMLRKGDSWNHIIAATGRSRFTWYGAGQTVKREAVAA